MIEIKKKLLNVGREGEKNKTEKQNLLFRPHKKSNAFDRRPGTQARLSTSPGRLHRKTDFNQQSSVMENGYPPLPEQYNVTLMSIRAERK